MFVIIRAGLLNQALSKNKKPRQIDGVLNQKQALNFLINFAAFFHKLNGFFLHAFVKRFLFIYT